MFKNCFYFLRGKTTFWIENGSTVFLKQFLSGPFENYFKERLVVIGS